jgi:hypothetical protein
MPEPSTPAGRAKPGFKPGAAPWCCCVLLPDRGFPPVFRYFLLVCVQNKPKLLIFNVVASSILKRMPQLQPPCKTLYHYNTIVAFTFEKKKAQKAVQIKRR